MDTAQSPYEALLESIAYQSISGKAAATIFARIKALSGNGRPPSPEQMLKLRTPTLRKAGLSGAKVLAMKDSPQNHRRHRPHPRASRKNIRRGISRAPRLRTRHRRLDRRDVPHLQSRPPGRPPYPRPGRAKRLVRSLWQETHAQAQGTPGFRRTLAPLPHRRQLVHVASLRARRLRRNQQNPSRQSKSKAPQTYPSPQKEPKAQGTQYVGVSAIFNLQYPRKSSMLWS